MPSGEVPENHEAGVGDLLAVVVVHLVAVAVALGRLGRAVQLGDERALGERRRVEAEAHGAAQVAAGDDVDLLGHRRDDRELGVGVELGRGRAGEAGLVAGVLDDHALQAEAQAERRDAVLAGEPQRAELALDAAHAEAAGHADAVDVGRAACAAPSGVSQSSDGDPLERSPWRGARSRRRAGPR